MDQRDKALQDTTPTFMVPYFGTFEPLETNGLRMLMSSNGVWMEVRLAWIYLRVQVAPPLKVNVPYGAVEPAMEFAFGKLPRAMVSQFIDIAKLHSPNECAAWVIWNQTTNSIRLQMLDDVVTVGPGHVVNNLPRLEDDEHIILDLHSHGKTHAHFSRTDNTDDRGVCKIAGVVGNLDSSTITTTFRLSANGLLQSLPFEL